MTARIRLDLAALVFGCIVISGTGAAANPASQLVVFGDSLSDSGNVPAPSPPYVAGRWSNGFTWADDLAARLGLGPWLEPSAAGGTNFARAGARILGSSPGLGLQIADYLERVQGQPDPLALHLVFIGGNDILDGLVLAATDPLFDPWAFVDARVVAMAASLHVLRAAGAARVAIIDLPDLSKVPGLPPALAPLASAMVDRFNAGLEMVAAVLSPGVSGQVWRVDLHALFDAMLIDAASGGARFGLTNATEPCLAVTGGVIAVCANPAGYLYWDPRHPTQRAHEIVADYVFEVLAAVPGFIRPAAIGVVP